MKGPEPKDYLGNEFLLWLWWRADYGTGQIRLSDRFSSVMLDKSIDLDCAYGETGKDSLRGTGPSRMPEAIKALQAGKVPRKAGIILDDNGAQYSFVIASERMQICGLHLPEVEDADTPRTLFEERITQLREFGKSIDAIYAAFLELRLSPSWTATRDEIRKWIQNGAK